jgi:hypothetical protein
MSVMTTTLATAEAAPVSLVDLMIDAAALVARIGQDRVGSVEVARGMVQVALCPGVDAFEVGHALGLRTMVDTHSDEAQRVALGKPRGCGSLSYVEVDGDTFPGDVAPEDDRRWFVAPGANRPGWTARD